MTTVLVTAIAAVSVNGVLGSNGRLPWHLPADLARFKTLTRGHHLIVGRGTWESIGRPLPGRTSIVLSRRPAPPGLEGVWVDSIASAIELAGASGDPQPFIAGGARVYRAAFEQDLVDRIELTEVHATVVGDVYFPGFDARRFDERSRIEHPADDLNRHAMTFVTLDRKR